MTRRNPRTRGARFPYEVQRLVTTAITKRQAWGTRRGFHTFDEAEKYAWAELTRIGGDWRVKKGRDVVASGQGYAPHEASDDRTAMWSRKPTRQKPAG